jgi:hypothetical protein
MQKFIIVGGAIVPMVGGVVTVMQFFFKADPCHLRVILMSPYHWL